MMLVRIAALFWVPMHLGMGAVMWASLFLFAGVATYGGQEGFLAYTPLDEWVKVGEDFEGRQVDNPIEQIKQVFDGVLAIGDTLWGLMAFDYNLLEMADPSDGIVYWGVIAIKLIQWGLSLAAVAALAEFIFRSGILQSTAGVAAVVGGGGLAGALTAVGALT